MSNILKTTTMIIYPEYYNEYQRKEVAIICTISNTNQIEYKRELLCCWNQETHWNNLKFLRSSRLNKKSVPCNYLINHGKAFFSTEIYTLRRESYFTHRRIHCLRMSCPRTTFEGFIAKHLFKAIISTFCCSIESALQITHDTSNSQEQGVRHVWSWSIFLRQWISG